MGFKDARKFEITDRARDVKMTVVGDQASIPGDNCTVLTRAEVEGVGRQNGRYGKHIASTRNEALAMRDIIKVTIVLTVHPDCTLSLPRRAVS